MRERKWIITGIVLLTIGVGFSLLQLAAHSVQEPPTKPTVEHLIKESFRGYLAGALVLLMFVVVVGVLVLVARYRKETKEETDEGKGKEKVLTVRFRRRSIQFLAVGLIVPTILILALNNLLIGEALATIVGTFIGYVLSGIGEEKD